ncbi:hypothetical protein [Streptomyces graminilatus]|uniref:hypothetical protein n=1 Tax=Streptomyces graminilatus TaxID=1464070 RepID=UPI0006E41D4B|nr:hypothetical protein [Streptomyces graminilatus]
MRPARILLTAFAVTAAVGLFSRAAGVADPPRLPRPDLWSTPTYLAAQGLPAAEVLAAASTAPRPTVTSSGSAPAVR